MPLNHELSEDHPRTPFDEMVQLYSKNIAKKMIGDMQGLPVSPPDDSLEVFGEVIGMTPQDLLAAEYIARKDVEHKLGRSVTPSNG